MAARPPTFVQSESFMLSFRTIPYWRRGKVARGVGETGRDAAQLLGQAAPSSLWWSLRKELAGAAPPSGRQGFYPGSLGRSGCNRKAGLADRLIELDTSVGDHAPAPQRHRRGRQATAEEGVRAGPEHDITPTEEHIAV
jgi:hypothetical protein